MPAGDGFKTVIGVALRYEPHNGTTRYFWVETSNNKQTRFRLEFIHESAKDETADSKGTRERCYDKFFENLRYYMKKMVIVDAWSGRGADVTERLGRRFDSVVVRHSWREFMLDLYKRDRRNVHSVHVDGLYDDNLSTALISFVNEICKK